MTSINRSAHKIEAGFLKMMRCLVIVCFIFLLGGCAYLLKPRVETEFIQLKPGQYSRDIEHSRLIFKVSHLGLSKFVGRLNDFDAQLQFDPKDVFATQLTAVVNMASVDVNNPAFEMTLRGSDWFNVESFPQALFSSTRVVSQEGSSLLILGDLTFLGQTHPITVRVNFNGGANNLLSGYYTLGFYASTKFKRSDFGLNKYLSMVGDEIELEIYAEFQRR